MLTLDPISIGRIATGGATELRLARTVSAPGHARACLRAVGQGIDSDSLDVAVLLVSEIVTNAVIHARGDEAPVGLRMRLADDILRVEVFDTGVGFDPVHPRQRPPEQGGRGLLIVEQLASRWGAAHDRTEGRFSVWFELDLESESADRSLAA